MLGFGRAAVLRCAPLHTVDQIAIQIADMQIASHPAPYEITALNDLTCCEAFRPRHQSDFLGPLGFFETHSRPPAILIDEFDAGGFERLANDVIIDARQ
jgi:hypothetical protein